MARALRKTYSPSHPYTVCRQEHDDGEITYEVIDERPDSYRIVCFCPEDDESRGQAKTDAELIVRALNLMNGGLPK